MKYRIGLLGMIGLLVIIGLLFPQKTSTLPDDVRVEFWSDTLDSVNIITDKIYKGEDFTKDESGFILYYYKDYNELSEKEGEILWDVLMMHAYASDYYEAKINGNVQKQNEAMNNYENYYKHFKKISDLNF